MDDFSKVSEDLKVLESYKDSEGHKVMVEMAYQKMSYYMAQFMADDNADLPQLRANFKAWQGLIESIDERKFEYKEYIKRVLEENERQAQKGMQNGRF